MRRATLLAAILASLAAGTRGTQDAVANGDTRSLSIVHEHTKESATVTFKRDGRYDREALDQLNWLLRDWRLDEKTRMEPKLFDAVWEAYRAVGSREPIRVVSAYRSPQTNAALRRRSRAVAEHSQHMLGKAMDFYLTDVTMDQVRAAGMRLQNGGVGYYPNAFNPFVHIDAGSVRHWPRMSHDQLARLFPDGKTVHLPADNRPLDRYEEARADVLARGGSVQGYQQVASAEEYGGGKSLWQMLFGGGDDEDSSFYGLNNAGPGRAAARRAAPAPRQVAFAGASNADDAGTRGALAYAATQEVQDPLRPARGGRALRAAPPAEEVAAPQPAQAQPTQVSPAEAPRLAPPEPPIPSIAAVPLPPRRPGDLAPTLLAGLVAAPLPPGRPRAIVLASADPDALPALVVRPSVPTPAVPAVAPAPALVPAPRPRAVEAPLDERAQLRSLFAAVTVPVPAAARPVAVAPARSRPDAVPGGLVSAAASGVATGFSAVPPDADLAAARFSGPSVKALPRR